MVWPCAVCKVVCWGKQRRTSKSEEKLDRVSCATLRFVPRANAVTPSRADRLPRRATLLLEQELKPQEGPIDPLNIFIGFISEKVKKRRR